MLLRLNIYFCVKCNSNMQNATSARRIIISAMIIAIGLVYIMRLFYIQVIDKSYKLSADNNVHRHITQYPARGLIYDRNGTLLVYNEAVYDLMVIPKQVAKIDTAELCKFIDITNEEYNKRLKEAREYSSRKSSIFAKQLSKETFGYLQEKMFKFPGFYVQARTVRKYPRSIASQMLGYVGEVSKEITDKDPYYVMGDYIGISGIESFYEKELRGKKGKKIMLVDVFNRIKGSFQNGKYDTAAIAGLDLYTTIDADLQEYGEKLMQNKKGGVVAIEPSTGEILALVSSPTYDPNLLVGRIRTDNYNRMAKDKTKPLFNRALLAKYPPGSTFKLVNALIGMQDSIVFKNSYHSCAHGFSHSNVFVKCHGHKSPLNLKESVQHSCNAYYCKLFRAMINQPKFSSTAEGLENWRKYALSFGFGAKLESDFSSQSNGFLPKPDYFNRYYGAGRWRAITIISLAIGQGEVLATPLQIANLGAIIANKGFYYTPHIVKSYNENQKMNSKFKEPIKTLVDSSHFQIIIDGMELAVSAGTATLARMDSITICGKTGTAQNPHGEDHSVFVAFAPKENPKIAIGVVVENAGYGGSWAAPIASLMIEKYINGNVNRQNYMRKYIEDKMLNQSFIIKEPVQ